MARKLFQVAISDAIARITRAAEIYARKKLAGTRWEHDAPDLAQEVALKLCGKLLLTLTIGPKGPEVVQIAILHEGRIFLKLEAFSRGAVNWKLRSLHKKAARRSHHDETYKITSFEVPPKRRTKDELIDAAKVLHKLPLEQRFYLLKDAVGLMAGADPTERQRLSRAKRQARKHAMDLGL